MVSAGYIPLLSLLLLCKADTEEDSEAKKMADKAIANVVDGFMKEEKRNTKSENTFGYWHSSFSVIISCFVRYFAQYTSVSKQLSRDARLVKKAMEELDNMATHGETNFIIGQYGLHLNTQSSSTLLFR